MQIISSEKCAVCGEPATGSVNLSVNCASSVPDRYEARCQKHGLQVSLPSAAPSPTPEQLAEWEEEAKTAHALARCAACWEPGARLLGNVRADSILSMCLAFGSLLTALRRVEGERDEACRVNREAFAIHDNEVRPLMEKILDEEDALRAENERLRSALGQIASRTEYGDPVQRAAGLSTASDIARRALTRTTPEEGETTDGQS